MGQLLSRLSRRRSRETLQEDTEDAAAANAPPHQLMRALPAADISSELWGANLSDEMVPPFKFPPCPKKSFTLRPMPPPF
jgi:hypothetical protein